METETLEKTKPTTAEDFLPLNGTDHVEFYVGNVKQSAYYYQTAWGYELVAYSGPETGVRDRASYVLQQGKVRFVFTTAMHPDHEITKHVAQHGERSAVAGRRGAVAIHPDRRSRYVAPAPRSAFGQRADR